MSELAVRPRLFAVTVKVYARHAQNVPELREGPDEVQHGAVTERPRAAERQAEDRSHVIFELAGLGAFDGPMAGIVDARRHLVRDQPPAGDEELDGQHAGIVEVAQQTFLISFGLLLQRAVAVRGDRVAQDARAVRVGRERVETRLAMRAAHADDRDFATEVYEF